MSAALLELGRRQIDDVDLLFLLLHDRHEPEREEGKENEMQKRRDDICLTP